MKETNFKQSELGLIPQDWECGSFKDFLRTFSSGATPYRAIGRYYEGEINWISSGELNYNTIFNTLEHISEEAVKNTNLTIHPSGTFLMAITGLEAAGTRGRCALIGKPSTTNQSCLAINSTDRMTVDYLFRFYQFWSEKLAFTYSQGSKQQSFTANIVRNLPIYAPKTLPEQERIASALSSMDALLSSLDKLITKKQDIRTATMQQLLTAQHRLPGFSKPWVEYSIESLGNLTAAGVDKKNNVNETQVRLVNYLDVFHRSKIYNRELNFWTTANDDKLEGCNVKQGDVFFTPSSEMPYDIALSAVAMETMDKVCYSYHIYRLRFTQEIDLNFKAYMFQTHDFFSQASLTCEGSGKRYVITLNKFKKMTIKMPTDLAEQRAIASILTSMDDELALLQAKRKKYEDIKSGMMQQLLTGKIRLI